MSCRATSATSTRARAGPSSSPSTSPRRYPTGGSLSQHFAVAHSPTDPTDATASADTLVHRPGPTCGWRRRAPPWPATRPARWSTRLTVHNHPGSAPIYTPTSGPGGPSDAVNVVVTDPLPLTNKKLIVQFLLTELHLQLEPATGSPATAAVVPFGTSVTFEIQVQVQGSNGTLTNRATVASPVYRPEHLPTTPTRSTTWSRAAPASPAKSPETSKASSNSSAEAPPRGRLPFAMAPDPVDGR